MGFRAKSIVCHTLTWTILTLRNTFEIHSVLAKIRAEYLGGWSTDPAIFLIADLPKHNRWCYAKCYHSRQSRLSTVSNNYGSWIRVSVLYNHETLAREKVINKWFTTQTKNRSVFGLGWFSRRSASKLYWDFGTVIFFVTVGEPVQLMQSNGQKKLVLNGKSIRWFVW